MRALLIAMVVLVGCRERGTIEIPLVGPCHDAVTDEVIPYDSVAVYFVRGSSCSFTCGLPNFTCDNEDCSAACASGYCTTDELDGLSFDPAPGDYAVVATFHYAGAQTDEAIACYVLHIDADGDQSHTENIDPGACCMGEP
ncbi:MAG TPA: hypothetical protein VGM90_13685 [Kofleriaceae bacterium]|jgi:hypothetical protein